MVVSEFQRSKLNVKFDRLDQDGNGYIEESAYVMSARHVAQAFGLAEDSAEALRAQRSLRQIWQSLSEMDTDSDGRISREEFIIGVAQNKAAVAAAVRGAGQAIFDLADRDKNGRLSCAELVKLLQGFHVPTDEAIAAFRGLDRDGDGLVSREEYSEGIVDNYISADSTAPGNFINGRIKQPAPAMEHKGQRRIRR